MRRTLAALFRLMPAYAFAVAQKRAREGARRQQMTFDEHAPAVESRFLELTLERTLRRGAGDCETR